MICKLFIILIHHQLFSRYGVWSLSPPASLPTATATNATATTTTSTSRTVTSSSSSSPSPSSSTTINHNRPPTAVSYRILSIETNCSRESFEIRVNLNRSFRGLLFAKDFQNECRTRGAPQYSKTNRTSIVLRLPTSDCGVRTESIRKNRNSNNLKTNSIDGDGDGEDDGEEDDDDDDGEDSGSSSINSIIINNNKEDGELEMSVKIMLQMDAKLRQSSDIIRRVKCNLPAKMMSMDLMGNGLRKFNGLDRNMRNKFSRHGRMRPHSPTDSTASDRTTSTKNSNNSNSNINSQDQTATPRVRIWLELGGPDGSGSVKVGQDTTLSVRALVPANIGVRVIDCSALDGLGESTQQLLDQRGCPVDEQVMPSLHVRYRPLEEGWSKPQEDDLIEKLFSATFPAFKFPDRERLHVSCGVQLCKQQCPEVDCRADDNFLLTSEQNLARIEVFNSLAVTAPQIEIDRYNMSVEENPPRLRTIKRADGTLCLSTSKLAISFCVLGSIFLIAIIVALVSLIRSRRRDHRCYRSPGISDSSMFSSSSDSSHSGRIASKLFIPYYPGGQQLPYGRVF
ncbi:hypothetical protein ACFFRR_001834 [Megaselia abdita]